MHIKSAFFHRKATNPLMVGMKGKKWKTKRNTFSQSNAKKVMMKKKKEVAMVMPSDVINQAHLSIVDSAGAASQDKGKDEEFKDLSGFIFLCSRETKLDCFTFRVFGLRSNKKKVVEKINPGTKLFLFDVELKLLYGVYEATTTGKLDLESRAFGGKYPAQVQFQIFKECLPLPEGSFRHAIEDNYRRRKFKPELNGHQVRNLLSLFRPLPASAAVPQPLAKVGPSLVNVGMPNTIPHFASEEQVKVLPHLQENVDPSVANVCPPDSSPAFAMEHQDKAKQQPPLSTAYVDEQITTDDEESSSSEDSQNESGQLDVLPGFIFLCGGNTKPDCYRFRVFGLPPNKKDSIEKIKPGTKLFLFDFELKLLYGVYEATSTGKMDLEPLAFGGKFPAQVKFRISKECLPLPEASFRQAIKENYHGIKFEPELDDLQVRDLLCLFRPLPVPAAVAVGPHLLSYPLAKVGSSVANVPPPNTVPVSNIDLQIKYPSMPVSAADTYSIRMQHVYPPPVMGFQPEVQSAHNGWHRATDFMEHPLAVTGHQGLTASSHTYSQPYLAQGISTSIQDPHLRLTTIETQSTIEGLSVIRNRHIFRYSGRNYQFYTQLEPPQESFVTPNCFYGPSAPFMPPIRQQNASEVVTNQRASTISFQYVSGATGVNF